VLEDSLAIVWKPIQGTSPAITGYELYVNDSKVGSQVRENNFVTVDIVYLALNMSRQCFAFADTPTADFRHKEHLPLNKT